MKHNTHLMSQQYMSSIDILVIITENTMFSQEALMPKSHSNDKGDEISANLPINVSKHVKALLFIFITYIERILRLYHII